MDHGARRLARPVSVRGLGSAPVQTTFGIDLASQPENTGVCVIAWEPGRARVTGLARGRWNGAALTDELLLACITGAHPSPAEGWGEAGAPLMTAIDAPFGWPEPFVAALVAHRDGRPWPAAPGEPRARFVRRLTDELVGADERTKLPLAVSADRIAYPAMRCAVLLGALAETRPPADVVRDGSGRVCEAYPDAALRCWLPDDWIGPKPDSYKGDKPTAVARRERLLDGLLAALGTRFSITAEQRAACIDADDALDALVCALLARAVQRGRTRRPQPGEESELARREGWIHLPEPGSLEQLLG